jgi:hypothetical protein
LSTWNPDRVLLVRLLAVAILVVAYYTVDWSPVQRVLTVLVASLLRALGHAVGIDWSGPDPALELSGRDFAVTANCTYMDLALVLAPLCWRARRGLYRNALVVALMSMAVLLLNPLRVVFAIHLTIKGAGWTYAHTVPDLTIHGVAISLAAILAFRSDWRPAAGSRRSSRDV